MATRVCRGEMSTFGRPRESCPGMVSGVCGVVFGWGPELEASLWHLIWDLFAGYRAEGLRGWTGGLLVGGWWVGVVHCWWVIGFFCCTQYMIFVTYRL